jgi:hypothetical protein
MSESKSKFLIPTLGAAIVVAGGVAAYLYFRSATADSSSPLGSAKVVPSTALIATYISTDPQAWAKLQQFGTPQAQQIIGKGLESLNQNLFSDSSISYAADIKPWVGGVMVAVLPPHPTKPAQSSLPLKTQPEPNVLLVVGIKDKLGALNFANKLKNLKNVKIQESDYKGQKIIESQAQGKPTYTAVLNNTHIVLAPEKQAVEKAIDTFKGEPSFAAKQGARTILAQGADVENSLAQIYVPDYASTIKQLTALNPQAKPLPPQTVNQLQQIKSVVAGVGVDEAGLRLKAIANLDPQLNKSQYQTTPAKIISQFPAATFALLSGQGINRSWQGFLEQSKEYPEFKQAVEQTRTQLKFVNIDLDQDIFSWMDGEFGVGAIQSNQGLLANVGFGGAFLIDTSDRKTAEATFAKLDNIAKMQALSVTQRNIAGKNITEWQIPQQGALLAHGWLSNNTVFVALGGPIADVLAERKGQSLETTDNFKAVTGSLPKPNAGYFYVDMEKTTSLIDRLAGPTQPVPPDAQAILTSIRGLGVTFNSPDKSTSQIEILLALKPKTSK